MLPADTRNAEAVAVFDTRPALCDCFFSGHALGPSLTSFTPMSRVCLACSQLQGHHRCITNPPIPTSNTIMSFRNSAGLFDHANQMHIIHRAPTFTALLAITLSAMRQPLPASPCISCTQTCMKSYLRSGLDWAEPMPRRQILPEAFWQCRILL